MSKTTKVRDKDVLEEIGQRIFTLIEDMIDAGMELKVDGMITLPVKYENGQFRQKPIQAGWEFFPEYVYFGAAGKMIIGMSSPDNLPETSVSMGTTSKWDTAEFASKHLDDAFPLLLPRLVEALLGTEAAKSPKYAFIDDLINTLYLKHEVEKSLEMETGAEKMMQLPTYGMF